MKPVALRLGIVGSEGAKFTPATEELARSTIRALIHKYNARMVVSGKCHLGGIDIWAADEARKLGIEVREFEPEVKQWNPPRGYGYKARNEDIVKHSDVVVCITVDKLPEGFTGPDYGACYHHKHTYAGKPFQLQAHVKSGGCWTMELARRMGKHGELMVIRTPESRADLTRQILDSVEHLGPANHDHKTNAQLLYAFESALGRNSREDAATLRVELMKRMGGDRPRYGRECEPQGEATNATDKTGYPY